MTADTSARFRDLHASGTFVMPNPWDIGSARLFEALGFSALATTSAGHAATLGLPDLAVARDELVEHVATLVAAVALPFNVDAERLFPDEPGGVAETVRLLAEAGAAGVSIEDYDPGARVIEDVASATARVAEAVGAARASGIVVTARAENHLYGHDDLDDTIARLIAYRDAGADVLYAPGLRDLDQIARVVREVDAPVNVIVFPGGPSVRELGAVGVRRVSTGGALASVAYGAAVQAAQELLEAGTATYPTGLARELRAAAFRPR